MKKPQKQIISLTINGEEYEVAVTPNRTLLEVLREDLSLTGAKEGCDDGLCGSCTVLLDGKPVRSCLLLAVEAQGRTTGRTASPSAGIHCPGSCPVRVLYAGHDTDCEGPAG